jgi:RNA polymerase sigma-70 factor (ECF subfamily)
METEKQRESNLAVETHQRTHSAIEIEKAFLENHEMVYRAAFRITGNASDAEDVLQTLFLRLVRREWAPAPELGWPAYLHRAAINIALDVVRNRARQAPLGDDVLSVPAIQPDPHREYSAAQLRQALSAALSELNPTAAEMFVLRYIEGLDMKEIARAMDTTRGVVAVTLFRTRSRLRKSIGHFLGANGYGRQT